jgi:hypothetical protein
MARPNHRDLVEVLTHEWVPSTPAPYSAGPKCPQAPLGRLLRLGNSWFPSKPQIHPGLPYMATTPHSFCSRHSFNKQLRQTPLYIAYRYCISIQSYFWAASVTLLNCDIQIPLRLLCGAWLGSSGIVFNWTDLIANVILRFLTSCTDSPSTTPLAYGTFYDAVHARNVGFEVFMAVTMKNAVFWVIKTQFVPHRRHVMSPLHSTDS